MKFSARRLLILLVTLACAASLAPIAAYAAYNDLTLTTAAVISVGGYTLDVSGSSAVIQSITVNTTSFSVTLASGSSLTVSSPSLQQLSSDVTSDVTNNTCTGSASSISLAYAGAGTVTNVITPSATVCTTASFGGGGSGGVGGGGMIVGSGPTAPSAAGTLGAGAIAPATATTSAPLEQSQIARLSSAASTTGIQSPQTTPRTYTFTQNLQYLDTSPEVAELQKYLNDHGFDLAQSGPGSSGEETDRFGPLTYAALVKFQDAYAAEILTPLGLRRGSGYSGPATRPFVNNN